MPFCYGEVRLKELWSIYLMGLSLVQSAGKLFWVAPGFSPSLWVRPNSAGCHRIQMREDTIVALNMTAFFFYVRLCDISPLYDEKRFRNVITYYYDCYYDLLLCRAWNYIVDLNDGGRWMFNLNAISWPAPGVAQCLLLPFRVDRTTAPFDDCQITCLSSYPGYNSIKSCSSLKACGCICGWCGISWLRLPLPW